jgi:mono/diheme cytochrome c family protein
MTKALALFSAVGLLAVACSSALPTPTPGDAQIAKKRWPDATVGGLERGRSLYVDKCAGCHALKLPNELEPVHWVEEVQQMRAKNGVQLSDDEAAAIAAYLFSVSSR